MVTERSDEAWSWMNDVMPIAVMLMITSMDMCMLTIVKAAMNDGMSSIVYIVYHDALGIFILLPFFIVGFFRFANKIHLCFVFPFYYMNIKDQS
ncbi:hypothetical protein Hdeb2414_s0006g00207361 [Helianthus debilis subsp. tardiflorus]